MKEKQIIKIITPLFVLKKNYIYGIIYLLIITQLPQEL